MTPFVITITSNLRGILEGFFFKPSPLMAMTKITLAPLTTWLPSCGRFYLSCCPGYLLLFFFSGLFDLGFLFFVLLFGLVSLTLALRGQAGFLYSFKLIVLGIEAYL